MCGIVGYVGPRDAQEILLEQLQKLEYRGYDSSGLVTFDADHQMHMVKKAGKISMLLEKVKENPLEGHIGIGHTRWATHGRPTDINAHPHKDASNHVVLVHNGIIENYAELKERFLSNVELKSETDTEVLVNVIAQFYEGDLKQAVKKALSYAKGSYALAVMAVDEPDEIILVRQQSPLVIGLGEGEHYIGSDTTAFLAYTRKCIYLEDGQIATIKADSLEIETMDGTPVAYKVENIEWDEESASKGGYEHFMLKEIHEQPDAFRKVMSGRIENGHVDLGLSFSQEQMKKWNKIAILGCGTAYHSGLVAKTIFEKVLRIPTEVTLASEFVNSDPLVDENTLTIVVSQSGETADTRSAMREAKAKGTAVLALTNVVGSSIAREADEVVYLWAGPEISVASTKAYTTMLIAFYLIALELGQVRGFADSELARVITEELTTLPELCEQALEDAYVEPIKKAADKLAKAEHIFYIGRSLDWAAAQEGALKLKEISYIHAEAYAAGELKHGTLALITEGTPIIAIALDDLTYYKTMSNVQEVVARGATVTALVMDDRSDIDPGVDEALRMPTCNSILSPILGAIPLQLLAYYTAYAKDCSIDTPRNLAKSVTVE